MTDSTNNFTAKGSIPGQSRSIEPGRSPIRRPLGGTADQSHVIIGAGAQLRGEVTNCSVLEVMGYADGEFTADRIVVHEEGELHGRVETNDVTVSGIVEGTVVVANKLDVREKGDISGDLTYRELSVEAGGSMTGNITVAKASGESDRAAGTFTGIGSAGQSAPVSKPAIGNGSMLDRLMSVDETPTETKTTLSS